MSTIRKASRRTSARLSAFSFRLRISATRNPTRQESDMGFSTAVPIAVQQQLADAGGILNSRAAAITEQLESLAGYLNGLPEIWSGSASTYYQGLQQEWNIAAKGLF